MTRTPRRRRGFTLIEMLVVVSIIVLLISMLLPALGRARKSTRNSICQNNLRQLGVGLTSYAVDNASWFPRHTSHNGNWMWDMTYEATDEIASRGGQKTDMFYCPTNTDQNVQGLWTFNPSFRVTGYFFTLKRINGPMAGWSQFLSGKPWLRTIHSSPTPDSAELVTDALIANGGDFTSVQGGWPKPHYSAHLDRAAGQPEGGNNLFLDNHVAWRNFVDMNLQFQFPDHWF